MAARLRELKDPDGVMVLDKGHPDDLAANVMTALERGDYHWIHMVMDYWPERVREKCWTNKSYAIAHRLE